MERTGLTDLDERVFEVRDKASRDLIREAIQAYRGGAYRSAIISTWIAISFDIISKVRELAAYGEANAAKFTKELNKAIQNNDLQKLQAIERDLLTKAKDEFQIITEREHLDLERILKDRHQCAHPAFVDEGALFHPLPELVRNHIVQSIDILLSHAPMQGKSALEQLERDLFSPSFPVTSVDMDAYMAARYAERVKESGLVKVMQSLITRVLGADHVKYYEKESKLAQVLSSLGRAKPQLFPKAMRDWLKEKALAIHDERLLSLLPFADSEPRLWAWLDPATKAEIKVLLAQASTDVLYRTDAYSAMTNEDLRDTLMARFNGLPPNVQFSIIVHHPFKEFATVGIGLYKKVNSYNEANAYGEYLILNLAPQFESDHLRLVLKAILENSEIHNARDTPRIVEALFDKTLNLFEDTKQDWREFVSQSTSGRKREDHAAFPGIRERLKQRGVMHK